MRGKDDKEYRNKLESQINELLLEYKFTQYMETRKVSGKLIRFFTLALSTTHETTVETTIKGVVKGFVKGIMESRK